MAGHVSGAYRGSGKEPEGLLGVDALDRCGDRGEMDTVLPFTCPVAVRQPVTQKFVSVECHRIAYAAFPFRDLVRAPGHRHLRRRCEASIHPLGRLPDGADSDSHGQPGRVDPVAERLDGPLLGQSNLRRRKTSPWLCPMGSGAGIGTVRKFASRMSAREARSVMCSYLVGLPRNPVSNVWLHDIPNGWRPWRAQRCPGRRQDGADVPLWPRLVSRRFGTRQEPL